MFSLFSEFIQALNQGDAPIVLVFVTTVQGIYVYGYHWPEDWECGNLGDAPVLDGSLILDGSWTLGGSPRVIDRGAYLLEFDPEIEETLAARGNDLLGSVGKSELTEFSAILDNSGGHFSDIRATDTFLSAQMDLRFGFRGLSYEQFLPVLSGRVRHQRFSHTHLEVTARK